VRDVVFVLGYVIRSRTCFVFLHSVAEDDLPGCSGVTDAQPSSQRDTAMDSSTSGADFLKTFPKHIKEHLLQTVRDGLQEMSGTGSEVEDVGGPTEVPSAER